MKSFSQSIVSIIFFASNFFFWFTTNYFDTSAEFKPLLHTWSLAVEEQYYVVFPLFLILIWRFREKVVLLSLLIVSVISLFAADWIVRDSVSTSYYLLLTRAWELMIGSMVAIVRRHYLGIAIKTTYAEVVGSVGALMLIYSIFFFDKSTPFPSFYALVPTLGAALIIAFSNESTLVGKFLSSKGMVGIGLISYSAYLWHQPIFAFARHRSLGVMNMGLMALLATLTLMLAYITWRYVERPFRDRRSVSRSGVVRFGVLGSVVLCAFGLVGHLTGGMPGRLPLDSKFAEIVLPKVDNGWCFYSVDSISSLVVGDAGFGCGVGVSNGRRTLLFGDSFAGQYEPFWDQVGKNLDLSVRAVTTNWCFPSVNDQYTGSLSSRAYEQCLLNRKWFFEHHAEFDVILTRQIYRAH